MEDLQEWIKILEEALEKELKKQTGGKNEQE